MNGGWTVLSGDINFEEQRQRFASIVPLGNNNATCCINDRNTVMLIVRDAASMGEVKDSIGQILDQYSKYRNSGVGKGLINRFRPTKRHSWRTGFEETERRLFETGTKKWDSGFCIDSYQRVILIAKERTTIEQIKSFIDEMLERELCNIGRELEAKPTEKGIKITVGRLRKRRMA